MRPVACAMDTRTLHASGTDPVVCWDKGCMKLDFNNGATATAKPAPTKSWLSAIADVKDTEVCFGTKCKKLGKKLVAAIAEAKQNHDPSAGPLSFTATTDLKAVIVTGDAWNVGADQKIKLTAPPLYRKSGEKPMTAGIEVAGDLLVVWWTACAGPCTKFSITDSSGRAKGPEGEGGGGMFQLDQKRFVVYGEYGAVSVFELGTAKPRGSIPSMTQEPQSFTAIRVDDDTVFAMYGKGSGLEVQKLHFFDDPTVKPYLGESQYLPNCTP